MKPTTHPELLPLLEAFHHADLRARLQRREGLGLLASITETAGEAARAKLQAAADEAGAPIRIPLMVPDHHGLAVLVYPSWWVQLYGDWIDPETGEGAAA